MRNALIVRRKPRNLPPKGLARQVRGSLTTASCRWHKKPLCIGIPFWKTLHARQYHLLASDMLWDACAVTKGTVQGEMFGRTAIVSWYSVS